LTARRAPLGYPALPVAGSGIRHELRWPVKYDPGGPIHEMPREAALQRCHAHFLWNGFD
jgi:hypothetical protein